jgi:hypothetical protein
VVAVRSRADQLLRAVCHYNSNGYNHDPYDGHDDNHGDFDDDDRVWTDANAVRAMRRSFFVCLDFAQGLCISKGTGYTGPTVCASPFNCVSISPPYYSQVSPRR